MKISDLTDEKVFKEKIIKQRRKLHRCPELSEEEAKTADSICAFLDDINVPYKKNIAGHGVMAWIEGCAPDRRRKRYRIPVPSTRSDACVRP